MAMLKDAGGTAFDRMLLTMMVEHREGAVSMATAELRDGQYGPAKQLAQSIQSSQSEEIAAMKTLLGTI